MVGFFSASAAGFPTLFPVATGFPLLKKWTSSVEGGFPCCCKWLPCTGFPCSSVGFPLFHLALASVET